MDQCKTPEWLIPYGYADGDYSCKCKSCGETFEGDKRALHCRTCAQGMYDLQNESIAIMPVTVARGAKDEAIVKLWCALRDLSDYGEDTLTEQDLTLWAHVTEHEAIQSRVSSDLPRVVAAAIIGKDGKIYSLPAPARHHHVGHYMVRECGHPTPFPGGDAQGFLLSNGEFASREHAKGCAEYHGQLLPGMGKCRELFSEDVW